MTPASAIRPANAGRVCAVAVAALGLSLGQAAAERAAMAPGFVYLRDVEPAIVQDIRYAGFDNFVGRPLAGYDAAECIVRRDAAAALKRVQADLASSGLALKVYDCYRPERAVRTMMQWSNDGRGGDTSKRFFPKLQKTKLFALGYIAPKSKHSTGTAIDLTLIESVGAAAAAFDPAKTYGPCTGAAAQRAPDSSIDMGTGYDCFDVASHTNNPAIGADQRKRRETLVAAMQKQGFKNYFREWWHFEYSGSPPLSYYDFPIRPHPAKPPPPSP